MGEIELEKCIVDDGPLCRSMSCSCRRRSVLVDDTEKESDRRKVRLRIVGSGRQFDSIHECAGWLRVSDKTVSDILNGKVDGGDLKLESI